MSILRKILRRNSPILRHIPGLIRPYKLNFDNSVLYVRLDDCAVGLGIALGRAYEPHVTRMIRSRLSVDGVFLDIGANIGYYSMMAANVVGPRGRVIAVEPRVDNCDLLRKSATANGFHNVEIHCVAASETAGKLYYRMDGSNGNIVSKGNRWDLEIAAARLDDELADLQRLDVVKIDIEGAEARALAGMRQLIRRHRPIIVSEFGPAGLRAVSDVEPDTYLRDLAELEYDLFRITPEGHAPIGDDIIGQLAVEGTDHCDLLALPAQNR